MDVSMPISSVIPSLDGPVLAFLSATTRPTGLAEIHQRVGKGSKSGIRRVLLRLVATGLVNEVPGGYTLNRQHLAAPAVEILAAMHGELIRRIRSFVNNWNVDISLVGLFGSAARRDGNSASDIDVLIVSESEELTNFRDQLANQIRSWTGNRAQVIAIPNLEFQRLRKVEESIVTNWEKELVVISGDIRALRRVM